MPPEKQIRCKARKSKPTCESNPDVCVWEGENCSYKNPAKKPCGNKKKESTCHKDADCEWKDDGCTQKKKNVHKTTSLAPEDKQRLQQLRLRMRVRTLIQPFARKNPADPKNRMRTYDVAKTYLDKTKKCLTWDGVTKRLLMGDVIDLTQRIGTPSKYGIVYLSQGKGMGRLIKVACKLMAINKSNRDEIAILDKVSHEVTDNNFMNFPMMYASIECDKPVCTRRTPECPSDVLKRKYFVVFNELADGDLKQWLHIDSPHTVDEYLSALFQIYMALAKLGSMNYVHNDMHWGNALYHQVPAGGWWWYRVAGTDYYIRNTGQMWVIWDFGMVKRTRGQHANGFYPKTDFYRIIHAFLHKNRGGWMEDKQHFPHEVMDVAKNILSYTKQFPHVSFESIFAEATKSGVPLPIGSQVPSGDRVLNDQPFIIPAV